MIFPLKGAEGIQEEYKTDGRTAETDRIDQNQIIDLLGAGIRGDSGIQ